MCNAKNGKIRTALASAMRKHGPTNFSVQVLGQVQTREELDNLERLWIAALDSRKPNGYNLDGGGGNGVVHESTKEKLRQQRLGIKLSPARCASAEMDSRTPRSH